MLDGAEWLCQLLGALCGQQNESAGTWADKHIKCYLVIVRRAVILLPPSCEVIMQVPQRQTNCRDCVWDEYKDWKICDCLQTEKDVRGLPDASA